jgi:hypothetical protein
VSNLTSYLDEAGLDLCELHFMNGFNDNEYQQTFQKFVKWIPDDVTIATIM